MNKTASALRPRPTIANIRASYTEEKLRHARDACWLYYYVIRWFSYPLAWLFIRLGISANGVSWISLVALIAGFVLFGFGTYWYSLSGALLVIVWALLDSADGHIARYTNSCSQYGAFLEELGAPVMTGLLFASIGIGLFQHADNSAELIAACISTITPETLFLFSGMWASLLYAVMYLARAHFFKAFSVEMLTGLNPGSGSFIAFVQKLVTNLIDFSSLLLPLMLLAAILDYSGFFVLLYAMVLTVAFIASLVLMLRKGRQLSAKPATSSNPSKVNNDEH